MRLPATRTQALDTLVDAAVEIACEPLFERFIANEPLGAHLLALIEEGADAEIIGPVVQAIWERSMRSEAPGGEWFHNGDVGHSVTDALQVLHGCPTRRDLYLLVFLMEPGCSLGWPSPEGVR